MQIHFTYDQATSSLPAGMVAALDYVASYFDALIANDITVNIEVGYGEISFGGQAITVESGGEGGVDGGADFTYAELVALLKTNASSAVDAQALSYLSSTDPSGGGEFFVSSAQEKAWGLVSPTATAIDGSIGFAVNGAGGTDYDFDATNRAASGMWDFVGIAEQEVAHALGRLTGLNAGSGWMALDLFRYGSVGVVSHAQQAAAYFSLNGGTTDLGNFAASVDPSDWARGTAADSFDVVAPTGVENPVSVADIDELNAIGFTTVPPDDDVSGNGLSLNLASYINREVNIYGGNGQADVVIGSNGTVEISSAYVYLYGDDDYADFIGGVTKAVSLVGDDDHVLGDDGTVNLAGARATVTGGGDYVAFVGAGSGNVVALAETLGRWDGVSGSNETIYLDSAQSTVAGASDSIVFTGAGDAVGLSGANPGWDSIGGSNGVIYLDDADTNVTGGGDAVYISGGASSAVSLYNSAGVWDGVFGSDGVVYLSSAQTTVSGGGDYVVLAGGADNAIGLSGTQGAWDGVAGSGGTIYLDDAQTTAAGGGDAFYLSGSGNALGLSGSEGAWDGVFGSSAAIYLEDAQTTIAGGGDAVYLSGDPDDAVGLSQTGGAWDGVFGAAGTIYLNDAQTAVSGGGDTIVFSSGADDAVGLTDTAGVADKINGSGGTIYLTSAQAAIDGDADAVTFSGSDNVSLIGGSESLLIPQGIGGPDVVTGFAATDSMRFSAHDFAGWSALQAHMSQANGNTVITLNAGDTVTLDGVAESSLTASQFRFA